MKTSRVFAVALAAASLFATQAKAGLLDLGLPHHEISVSYGTFTSTEYLDAIKDIIVTGVSLGEVSVDNDEYTGGISAQYLFRPIRWVSVGASATYERRTQDCIQHKDKVGEQQTHFLTVMPTVRLSWVNRRFVTMYTKAAAGLTILADSYKDMSSSSNTITVESEKTRAVAFQISPIGILVGRRIFGFAEVGFGAQGAVLLGVGYRFLK